MKRIAIVTGYYHPLQTPRAFRATELSLELSRRGYHVDVYSATQNFDTIFQEKNLNVFYLNAWHIAETQPRKSANANPLKSFLKKCVFYFTTGTLFSLFIKLKAKLIFKKKYNVLISIGLPFHIHWAVGRQIKSNNIAERYIADYGDPFSKFNKTSIVAPYFRWIEKKIMNKFDFITIPTIKSLPAYLWLKDKEKIRIIPQGFDFSKIKLKEYRKNKIPTFAFAGNFYQNIRDPKILFDYLCKLEQSDFKFILYIKNTQDNLLLLNNYVDKLGSKIEIRPPINRQDLIPELSSMDFLINQDNFNSVQSPSKLIDYLLTGRPIFNFNQDQLNINLLDQFLHYDFSSYQSNINIEDYDIRNITTQFEQIF
ncbi:hypothetical protein [Niabella beijingensis]|uniref:hypothetical protein n=1 Tax=Niabella beijingensis TaxID=2872700 RepID=UPI001CBBC64E|nr:hypothetical protein [Niabella beijingensis]MBZ4191518.1 hypothetical protein [Niabella beijingensis]